MVYPGLTSNVCHLSRPYKISYVNDQYLIFSFAYLFVNNLIWKKGRFLENPSQILAYYPSEAPTVQFYSNNSTQVLYHQLGVVSSRFQLTFVLSIQLIFLFFLHSVVTKYRQCHQFGTSRRWLFVRSTVASFIQLRSSKFRQQLQLRWQQWTFERR